MNETILHLIQKNFHKGEIEKVTQELSSISFNKMMAHSEYNLQNTQHAILKLAKGKVEEIIYLTQKAKIDFRDVIRWAILEEELKEPTEI